MNLEWKAHLAWKQICGDYIAVRTKSAGRDVTEQLWQEEWALHPITRQQIENHFQFEILHATAIIKDRYVQKQLPEYVFDAYGNTTLCRVFNVERARRKPREMPVYPDEIKRSEVVPLEDETMAAHEVHREAVKALLQAIRAAQPLFEVFRDYQSQEVFQQSLAAIAKRHNRLPYESILVSDAASGVVRDRCAVYPGMSVEREAIISNARATYAPMLVRPSATAPAYTRGWQAVSAEMSDFVDKVENRALVVVALQALLADQESKKPRDPMTLTFPKQLIDTAAYGYTLLSKMEQDRVLRELESLREAREKAEELETAIGNGNDEARLERMDNRALQAELKRRVTRREQGEKNRSAALAPVLPALNAAVARVEEAAKLHAESKAKLQRIVDIFNTAVAVYEEKAREVEEENRREDHDVRVAYDVMHQRIVDWLRMRAKEQENTCESERARHQKKRRASSKPAITTLLLPAKRVKTIDDAAIRNHLEASIIALRQWRMEVLDEWYSHPESDVAEPIRDDLVEMIEFMRNFIRDIQRMSLSIDVSDANLVIAETENIVSQLNLFIQERNLILILVKDLVVNADAIATNAVRIRRLGLPEPMAIKLDFIRDQVVATPVDTSKNELQQDINLLISNIRERWHLFTNQWYEDVTDAETDQIVQSLRAILMTLNATLETVKRDHMTVEITEIEQMIINIQHQLVVIELYDAKKRQAILIATNVKDHLEEIRHYKDIIRPQHPLPEPLLMKLEYIVTQGVEQHLQTLTEHQLAYYNPADFQGPLEGPLFKNSVVVNNMTRKNFRNSRRRIILSNPYVDHADAADDVDYENRMTVALKSLQNRAKVWLETHDDSDVYLLTRQIDADLINIHDIFESVRKYGAQSQATLIADAPKGVILDKDWKDPDKQTFWRDFEFWKKQYHADRAVEERVKQDAMEAEKKARLEGKKVVQGQAQKIEEAEERARQQARDVLPGLSQVESRYKKQTRRKEV
jgi:hypothetical protein